MLLSMLLVKFKSMTLKTDKNGVFEAYPGIEISKYPVTITSSMKNTSKKTIKGLEEEVKGLEERNEKMRKEIFRIEKRINEKQSLLEEKERALQIIEILLGMKKGKESGSIIVNQGGSLTVDNGTIHL